MSDVRHQGEGTNDVLKHTTTKENDNMCYGCFGAANNGCQRCETERGKQY